MAGSSGNQLTSIPIGARNCPVTILQPVKNAGIQTWQVVGRDMVNLSAASGSETPNPQLGPPNQVMSTVVMLYRPGLRMRPKMRLQYIDNGVTRLLEIDTVINVDQLNRVLQLQVREVTN